MELFKLFGTVVLNNQDANKGLDSTTEKAGGLGEKFKSGIATAAKWGVAVAAGATAVAGAMMKVATSAASTTDHIDKMSQKIGISRQAYQELDFICSQSGTSVDTLQQGVKTLTSQMQAAADGTKTASSMFKKLGVSVYDSTGKLKDQETMMWEAMSALQKMENQTEKAALATDLFGRSGTELMPLLNGASGSIEEMKEKAHELGLVLSDDAIDAGVVFTDTLDQAKRSLSAIVTNLGVSVMPVIQTCLDWFIDKLPAIQETASQVWSGIKAIWEMFGRPVFDTLLNFITIIKDAFVQHMPEIEATFSGLWEAAKQTWETLGLPIWNAVQSCISIVKEVFAQYMPEIREFVSSAFGDIGVFWEQNLKPCFEAIGNFIENVLAPIFEVVFEARIRQIVATAFDYIKNIWEGTLKPVLTGITDFLTGVFTGDFEKAWQGIESIFKGIMNGIITGAETMVNSVINGINGLIEAINDISVVEAISEALGIDGLPTIPTLSLPRLAKGGILEKGQLGLLEGDGAEAVVPLDQNKKWISAVAQDMDAAVGGGGRELREMKEAFADFVDALPDMLVDAFASMKFDVNNREFARLVKAVN